MASVTDWVATSALTLIGLAAGINVARGTFPQWLRAKFLLDAPPPAFQGIPAAGSPLTPTTPVSPVNPNPGGGGGQYGDPLPSGQLISAWGDCRTGLTCSGSCCRRHKGIDLGAPSGTPVLSIAPGTVARAGSGGGGCGLRVAVRHADGSEAIYCHLSALATTTGTRIASAGVPLGAVGNTGNAAGTTPHLHFELHRGGQAVDPTRLIGR